MEATHPHVTKAPPGAPHLLDVPATATYLSVSERFVRRLIAERRLPFVKLGKFVRFDVAALDTFIEEGRVDSAPARTATVSTNVRRSAEHTITSGMASAQQHHRGPR